MLLSDAVVSPALAQKNFIPLAKDTRHLASLKATASTPQWRWGNGTLTEQSCSVCINIQLPKTFLSPRHVHPVDHSQAEAALLILLGFYIYIYFFF